MMRPPEVFRGKLLCFLHVNKQIEIEIEIEIISTRARFVFGLWAVKFARK
jgi:hypothetical protein